MSADSPAPARAGWLVVAGLLLLQLLLFRQLVLREIVPAVPWGCDQTSYLHLTYVTYEAMLDGGLWHGLRQGWKAAPPAGALMHLQGASLMLVLGPGRLTALLPHFLY